MKERLVELRGADPAQVVVIHNWGDREAMSGAARDNPFSRENRLLDRFVVMHAGNMGLGQGLESLVEAAVGLASDCPDLELVFVGDGSKRASLEALARASGAGNVRFLPYLPRQRIRESYAAADLFVISLKRGLGGFIVPSKLYSILAAGKPYVAAVDEDSEVAAITRRFGSGALVAAQDAARLAEEIRSLYRDRPRLTALGEGARAAAGSFDRPVAIQAYDRLLKSLSGPRVE
jgi:colanic acid biosynthesis glycosyl transferase WcaI